jgi:hypothetical protein
MWRIAIAVALMTGCGDGGTVTPDAPSTACKDMGGSACFQLPTAPLSTRDGVPSALGCGPVVPVVSSAAVTISGNFGAYGTNAPIVGGQVALYASPDYVTPVATATSQADATYAITLPAGSPDLLWGTIAADGFLTTYVHASRPDLTHGDITMFNLRTLTSQNVESAGLLVKEDWDPAFTVIAGTVIDCSKLIVEHAAVVLSSTSKLRTFVPGATVYYGAPGAVPLAVPPDQRGDTNDNGIYAIFRVPSSPTYVQVWGFVDAAAQGRGEAGLTLISEWPVHAVANSVIQFADWVNQ